MNILQYGTFLILKKYVLCFSMQRDTIEKWDITKYAKKGMQDCKNLFYVMDSFENNISYE